MGRITSNRKLAEALLKTLRHLEADPSVDPHEPAFIHLKSTLLERVIGLELNAAEAQSSLHLVERHEPDPGKLEASDESDSAIA